MDRGAKYVPNVALRYWGIVSFMRDNAGLYSMDDKRAECHKELCRHYGISESKSRKVTDHLDKHDVISMHDALENLSLGTGRKGV